MSTSTPNATPAARPTAQLDTLGTLCPLPLLKTAKAMLDLESGQLLEVVGDDRAILEDMPVFCVRAGHRLVSMTEEDGVVTCLLEKL